VRLWLPEVAFVTIHAVARRKRSKYVDIRVALEPPVEGVSKNRIKGLQIHRENVRKAASASPPRSMAAGDGARLPATVAASRSVEKALEEASASGALHLAGRKLKEFPRSARNYDLSDVTHAGECGFCFLVNIRIYNRILLVGCCCFSVVFVFLLGDICVFLGPRWCDDVCVFCLVCHLPACLALPRLCVASVVVMQRALFYFRQHQRIGVGE